MDLEEAAIEIGIDLKKAIGRFAGSRMLYEKYLKKFLEDSSMSELEQAAAEKNFLMIEHSAHTIKGVCANLGLNTLAKLCGDIVQCVRNNEGELLYSGVSFFDDCRKEYERICGVLKKLN